MSAVSSAPSTSASQTGDLILIDGISVITGSQTSNESDAVPVLLSDVEFEATLILATKDGPGGMLEAITTTEWRRAKRQAVLIRLLAAKARYLHETATDEDKQALLDEITAAVGGDSAMAKILARQGLSYQELEIFAETAALALTQLRYFEEQVDLPGTRRGARRRSRQRSDTPTETGIVGQYRRLIQRDQTEEQMKRWISELINNGHIRMIR